jgi:alpha-tubulin suppressor-like RCC1 family protein
VYCSANLENVAAVSCGLITTGAVKQDGTVVSWGDNVYGQNSIPSELANVLAISSCYQTIALGPDRKMMLWCGARQVVLL